MIRRAMIRQGVPIAVVDQGCHPIGYADDIIVIVRGMHLYAVMA